MNYDEVKTRLLSTDFDGKKVNKLILQTFLLVLTLAAAFSILVSSTIGTKFVLLLLLIFVVFFFMLLDYACQEDNKYKMFKITKYWFLVLPFDLIVILVLKLFRFI